MARPTIAGTQIENVASVDGLFGSQPFHAVSNVTLLRTGEILDCALSAAPSGTPVPADTHDRTVTAQLANGGNGEESFHLAAVTDPSIHVTGLAIDMNRNGVFDAGSDVLLGTDAETGPVAAGATITILVLVRTDAVAPRDGLDRITLIATARTGSGKPGTPFAGQGDGGGDAVVGRSSARAEVVLPLGAEVLTATLTKAQAVSSPGGGEAPVAGAVITYTLNASFAGQGSISDVRISDPIPAGTRYVAGSLRLDGAPFEGGFDGSVIDIALGTVRAPAAHTIVFQATIQ